MFQACKHGRKELFSFLKHWKTFSKLLWRRKCFQHICETPRLQNMFWWEKWMFTRKLWSPSFYREPITFISTAEKSYSIQIPNSAQTPSCTVRLKHHSIMKKKNLFWSDLLSKNFEDLYFIIFLSLISHLWISLWPSDESPRICKILKNGISGDIPRQNHKCSNCSYYSFPFGPWSYI